VAGIEMNLASGRGEIVVIQERQLLLTKSTLTNPRLCNLDIHIVIRSIQAPGLANSAQISGQRPLVAYHSSSNILVFLLQAANMVLRSSQVHFNDCLVRRTVPICIYGSCGDIMPPTSDRSIQIPFPDKLVSLTKELILPPMTFRSGRLRPRKLVSDMTPRASHNPLLSLNNALTIKILRRTCKFLERTLLPSIAIASAISFYRSLCFRHSCTL
jgi:hypothetical protein